MQRRTAILLLLGAASDTAVARRLTPGDDDFLEDLCHRAFRFFLEQTDPHTGLVFDRARADGSREKRSMPFAHATPLVQAPAASRLAMALRRSMVSSFQSGVRLRLVHPGAVRTSELPSYGTLKS